MVRYAGQNSTMDNREEILDALNDFSRKQPKEIPPLLEQFLKQVAKTGETLFPWTLLKALFVTKLEQVMNEFNEECVNDEVPTCPNVENARFEVYRERIMEAVHRFHGAPFTIQRLCELLTDPKRHYKRCDKFMRGLEKNVLVVSTVDPFGRKVVSESKNLVNGMDTNNSSSEDPATPATSSGSTSTTPPVPAWPSPSSSSSPTTTWPVQADLITPSTAPLLEVCDLPDPKEPPSIAGSAAPAVSSEPLPVNGHDAQSSGSSVTLSSNVSEVSSTPSTELSELASMEETVDSSDQQVAAEEMVGVEEEAATSTAISQEAAGVVEETVVETPPMAAEVMKETSDLADSSAEVTPAASGDWLANITDKPADAKTDSQEEPSAESQNCSNAESSEASPAADLQDKTVSDSEDRLSAESQDGATDHQASSMKDESCVSVAGASDTEPSTETTPADTSVQADTDSSEAKAACGAGEGGEKRQEEEEKTNSGTTKMEESSTEAGHADDTVEVKSADTAPAETVCTDSAITTPTSPTASEPQEHVSCTSPVSSSETNTTPASSEVSTPQRASPSNSPSADAEPTDCSTSDAVESAVSATPAAASPTAPLPAPAEEKCEDADTSSAVPMETDSASSSEDVSKAADEPDAAVSSSSSNSSSEKAEEAETPSTDTTSQAEAMDQD